MRSDMAKVIVERPRRKDWKGDNSDKNPFHFNRNSGFDEEDDLDMDYINSKESMRKTHKLAGSYKELNENLSPLYNFIKKNVGRKWNNVYSEIRAAINANSATQLHILEHVKSYVCTDPQAIYEALNHIYLWRFNNNNFYVDEEGKLRKFPSRPKYVRPELSKNVIFGEIEIKKPHNHGNPHWTKLIQQRNDEIKGKKFPTHFCFNGQWFGIDWYYDYFAISITESVWSHNLKRKPMLDTFNRELLVGRRHMKTVFELFPKTAYLRFRNLTKKELKELKKKLEKE